MSEREHRPPEVVEAELAEAEALLSVTEARRAEALAAVEACEQLIKQLAPDRLDRFRFGPTGKISRLRQELSVSQTVERDRAAPRVRVEDRSGGWVGSGADWILVKVTPKRIFMRKEPAGMMEQFDRNTGEGIGWRRRIVDLPACLAAWEAMNASSKETR